jgi:hypothetical protein
MWPDVIRVFFLPDNDKLAQQGFSLLSAVVFHLFLLLAGVA